jgi:hypothetical protein
LTLVKAAFAAVRHRGSPVTSNSRTNTDSARPCAIPEYHGARSISLLSPSGAKSKAYGKYHAPSDSTRRSTNRCAFLTAIWM